MWFRHCEEDVDDNDEMSVGDLVDVERWDGYMSMSETEGDRSA